MFLMVRNMCNPAPPKFNVDLLFVAMVKLSHTGVVLYCDGTFPRVFSWLKFLSQPSNIELRGKGGAASEDVVWNGSNIFSVYRQGWLFYPMMPTRSALSKRN